MNSNQATPVELLSLEMDQILEFFLSITSTKAALYLEVPMAEGLDAGKDLEKARLAIDCTQFLVEKLQPYVTEEESNQLNFVVSNLQLAYVKESS
jgi:hypothetical protein